MRLVARVAALFAALCLLLHYPVAAQADPDRPPPLIVINLPSRTLELFSGNTLVKTYPVAIGKPSTPTPLGTYRIFEKEVNPAWFPPRTGETVPSGPGNPLGYRWMGFSELYGIHGTNAPWAIGQAVSNGCVRMNESDVEELFEQVSYGTTVQVNYDRVKVRFEADGQVSIGIYPDVYGYLSISVASVKQELAGRGLAGVIGDEQIAGMIEAQADRQVTVARTHMIRVNGQLIADKAMTVQDAMLVPVWPVAAALGADVSWDEAAQMVRGKFGTASGLVKHDVLFVTAEGARALFDGQQEYRPDENVLAIDSLLLLINGRPFAGDVRTVDGILAVPVANLAEAVGVKVAEAADGTLLVQGGKVPCVRVGDRAYIQLTKVYDVFKAYVYWDREARTIEFTYPFQVKGGTD